MGPWCIQYQFYLVTRLMQLCASKEMTWANGSGRVWGSVEIEMCWSWVAERFLGKNAPSEQQCVSQPLLLTLGDVTINKNEDCKVPLAQRLRRMARPCAVAAVLHKTDAISLKGWKRLNSAIATDQEVGRRALLQKPHGGLACFGIATPFAAFNLTSLHDYRFINVKHWCQWEAMRDWSPEQMDKALLMSSIAFRQGASIAVKNTTSWAVQDVGLNIKLHHPFCIAGCPGQPTPGVSIWKYELEQEAWLRIVQLLLPPVPTDTDLVRTCACCAGQLDAA